MRIIAGKYKGRRITRPKSIEVRPTKDRVRQAVFNIIAEKVPDSSVLDIFAGSGAYGLEAISRGARKVVFIERDKVVSGIIRENIRLLGIEENLTEVITTQMPKAIEFLGRKDRKFDLIFCDPPYSANMVKKTLIMVNHYDILNHSGLVIIEHHRDESIPSDEGNVFICKQKTYGKTLISILKKNDKKSNISGNF